MELNGWVIAGMVLILFAGGVFVGNWIGNSDKVECAVCPFCVNEPKEVCPVCKECKICVVELTSVQKAVCDKERNAPTECPHGLKSFIECRSNEYAKTYDNGLCECRKRECVA